MSAVEALEAPSSETEIEKAARLLGGRRVLGRSVTTEMDAHDLLSTGLPGRALHYLVDHVPILSQAGNLERALGLNVRTLQRRREAPDRPLTAEQSNRVWRFAEVLGDAIDLLGDQKRAEDWLGRPAVAFGGRRPIEMLATAAGIEMVETLIGQLKYGVYV